MGKVSIAKNQKFGISVVIPTRNRHEDLEDCLKAVKKQDYTNYEIIIVDDNSSCRDENHKLALKYDARHIYNEEWMGTPIAYNIGILNSKKPLVVFTDDDCVPSENWLTSLINAYKKSNAVIVGSRVLNVSKSKGVLKKQMKTSSFFSAFAKIIFGLDNSVGKVTRSGRICTNYDNKFEGFVDVVTGGSLMIDKDKTNHRFLQVKKGVNRYHDTFFCYRVGRDDGDLYFTSESSVFHNFTERSRLSYFDDLFDTHYASVWFNRQTLLIAEIVEIFGFVVMMTKDKRYISAIKGKIKGWIDMKFN